MVLPSASSLAAHAQVLAGRISDFRWWGDRLSLTVSIGAAQAVEMESLPQLFETGTGRNARKRP
jgi:hypothetical protein